MSLTVTRNPNLTRPLQKSSSTNLIQQQFGDDWWTGLPPEKCVGFDRERRCLNALPFLNLEICSRQDILDYFNNTWTLTELLFSGLKTAEAFVRPPYHQLRHPMIFYYGHPAVLFVNKLRVAGLLKEPLDLFLEKVLETGVDEMSWDDMSKNEMNWPSVQAVHGYRRKVYEAITHLIKTHPDIELSRRNGPAWMESPLWALWMGFEHEKIHFETSSVLIRELPVELVEAPKFWAPLHPSAPAQSPLKPTGKEFQSAQWLKHAAQRVTLGKNAQVSNYGWDNEYGSRSVNLKEFQYTRTQITNGEYYEFVASGAYIQDLYWTPEGRQWRKFRNTKRPTFWAAVGPEGAHEYELRTVFEFIPMPWNWPVEVNFHEAQAYCRWKKEQDHSSLQYRMLTEGEYSSLRREKPDEILQKRHYAEIKDFHGLQANFNFLWSSPGAVDAEMEGNVWHWLEDQFNPLPGFKTHSFYDDFSTPCFDGKHQMLEGGSFISCGNEASREARFHFRPHFYQHSGFRMAASLDGSADNGSVKLISGEEYVHPHRRDFLDQMQTPDWWKQPEQPLEMNGEELRQAFAVLEQRLLQFNKDYPQMSPMGLAHDPRINSVPGTFKLPYHSSKNFPAQPESFEKLLGFIFDEMAPLSQWPGHPGYAAYVAGAGNMMSNFGQLISQTLNPFSGHYMMAPGLVALEAEVLQWFMDLMEFPAQTAGGFLTTGSSLATLSAMAMARQKLVRGKDFSKVTLYVSDQTHHSVQKAWNILGFEPQNIRTIASSRPDFRMKIEGLEKILKQDVEQGLQPLMLVGTAGTTNTGAIDPLRDLARIAQTYKIWYHVDGAYGALFKLTEAGREKLQGLEAADSVVFDLHKSLGLSYGTGCLLVKDRKDMLFSTSAAKSYMPPEISGDDGLHVDFADITPELSRDYRGLRVWLPLKVWGISPFKVNLEEKLRLSEWLQNELAKIPEIEIVAAPQLSIQAFTLKISSDRELNNKATKKLMEKINHRGVLFLSACELDGKKAIRFCLLSFRLHWSRLQEAVKELPQQIAVVKKEMGH